MRGGDATPQNVPPFDPDTSLPKLLEMLTDEDQEVVFSCFKMMELWCAKSTHFKSALLKHRCVDVGQ